MLNWNCAEQASYSDGFTEVKVGPKVATVSEFTLEPSWQEFGLKSAQGQGVNFFKRVENFVARQNSQGSLYLLF